MKPAIFALLFAATFGVWDIPIDDTDSFFTSHYWRCETDAECMVECLALAESRGVDTDICDETNELERSIEL